MCNIIWVYLLILLCMKQLFKEIFCVLCSELSQEIDILQEIYIDELQIETNTRFYNSAVC